MALPAIVLALMLLLCSGMSLYGIVRQRQVRFADCRFRNQFAVQMKHSIRCCWQPTLEAWSTAFFLPALGIDLDDFCGCAKLLALHVAF